MDGILFKAKRKDNGRWVEGFYWTDYQGNHFITSGFCLKDYEIDIDTLCVYTGKTDTNYKKIWTNDICKCKLEEETLNICFSDDTLKVEWDEKRAGFVLVDVYGEVVTSLGEVEPENIEVIGNTIDDRELF